MQNEEQVAKLALVKNILNILCLLSNHLKIYPQGNQVVRVTTSRLFLQLEKFFSMEDHLDLIVARHGFIFEDIFIDRSNLLYEKFAHIIFMHGVGAIKLHAGVSEYEMNTLLRLIGRNPAESWDEGGVQGCLEVRRIDNIEVIELSEQDFLLCNNAPDTPVGAGVANPSDLWTRFALGTLQRQHGNRDEPAPDDIAPEELARATNTFLAQQESAEQQQFIREVSTFLVSLQHENIHIYLAKALEKLASYINHLSPKLKHLFLKNVFNYNLKTNFAEDFFSKLSDDMIMDALENAAMGKNYVPPVVLNLLGRLARSREILPADLPLPSDDNREALEQKTRELFRSDEFEKFVPEQYRDALMKILGSEEIDGGYKNDLSRLKATLQDEKLEEHTGQIIVHILSHDADERHLGGLYDNLEKFLDLYAETGNYLAINEIRKLCLEQGSTSKQSLMQVLESPTFVEKILGGGNRFGKEKYEALGRLIEDIGVPLIDPILDRLATEKNRSTRYFFIQCLKGMGGSVAERASQRLRDHRWYYLRNLLALLRDVGDPAMAGSIRPLFLHAHPKVRHEAIKTGLYFHDAQAQHILLELLDSRESAVVAAAVALARMSQEPRIFTGLTALLEKNELFDYHLELKRAVAAALIEINQRQALPVLQRFIDRFDLFHPLHHAQFSREIVKMLERFDPPLVIGFLRQLAVSSDKEQARIAKGILNRIPGGKP